MPASSSQRILSTLNEAGVSFFTSVPCKSLNGMIKLLETGEYGRHIPVTREDEGIGICAGAHLAGARASILMQNTGLGLAINAIATLATLYALPIVLFVSYRGTPGEKVIAQGPMAEITEPLLHLLRVPTLTLHETSQLEELGAFVTHGSVMQKPIAILADLHFWSQ